MKHGCLIGVLLTLSHCLLPGKSKDNLDLATLLSLALSSSRTARFLYVGNNAASSTISVYSINASTGSLTGISAASTGNGAQGICIEPGNRYLYVTGSTANGVSQFSVNSSTGALTSMSPSLVGGIASPYALAADPLRRAVYVPAGTGNTIYPFSITSSGTLSSLSTVTAGSFMQGIAVDPAGKFAFVPAATGNAVYGFAVNSTSGALSATAQVSIAQAGATSVAVHPNGLFLYALSNASGTLFIYSVNPSSGALSGAGSVSGLSDNTGIVLSPGGEYLYVSQAAPTNRVSMFGVNASTGALTSLSPAFVTVSNPLAAGAIDPTGRFFYVTNYSANTVTLFTISSGILTSSSVSNTGTNPWGSTILSY